MELGHSQIETVNSCACICMLYVDMWIYTKGLELTSLQYTILCLLCAFLLCCVLPVCLPLVIGAHIPSLAISDVGAKAGSEGLKCWDCSPCTTRLFSASCAARHFQTAPHSSELNSLTGCICICQHVHMDTDIILACMTLWSAQYGFARFAHANLLDVKTGNRILLSSVRW